MIEHTLNFTVKDLGNIDDGVHLCWSILASSQKFADIFSLTFSDFENYLWRTFFLQTTVYKYIKFNEKYKKRLKERAYMVSTQVL